MASEVITVEAYVSLQRTVTKLHFGSEEEKKHAATAIEKLARESISARAIMVNLGAIPTLVDMMESSQLLLSAVDALIAIVYDSVTNRERLLEAGFLLTLPKDTTFMEEQERTKVLQLVLQLSSFTHCRPVYSDKIMTFVSSVLDAPMASIQSKIACLEVLRQLSEKLGSALAIASNGVVPSLLRLVLVKELSGSVLKILCRLMGISRVVRIMEKSASVPADFIEALKWKEHRSCQESSAYILMVLWEKSREQRGKMMSLEIVPVVLEVALLGTPLAQKTAMRMMRWFQDEADYHSKLKTPRISKTKMNCGEGRRLMKDLVRQSLENNLKSISLRATSADQPTFLSGNI